MSKVKRVASIRADEWTKAFQRQVDAGNCIVYEEKIDRAYKAEDGEYDHFLYDSDHGGGEIWVNHQSPFKVFWRDEPEVESKKDERITQLETRITELEGIIDSITELLEDSE